MKKHRFGWYNRPDKEAGMVYGIYDVKTMEWWEFTDCEEAIQKIRSLRKEK